VGLGYTVNVTNTIMRYKVLKMVTMTITIINRALPQDFAHCMTKMKHSEDNVLGTGSISIHI
jgi:hypothetical protein